LDLLERYGPAGEKLSDEQLELLEREPGVSSPEVEAESHGSLDDGHWPTAMERQRAAAIEHLGSRRLLIRFNPEPSNDPP
jgi:hypothetical protein